MKSTAIADSGFISISVKMEVIVFSTEIGIS